MDYTVNKLSKLSGVSARTLRYYDEIGLLKPSRISESRYRFYGDDEVALLQQILFYRELGIKLDDISEIIHDNDFDRLAALSQHMSALVQKKAQIELLIENVNKTILSLKGEITMSDKEKFEGFKKELINENEKKYGDEIRQKYGEDAVNASNAKLSGMNEDEWNRQLQLKRQIADLLKSAVENGNPSCIEAQNACDFHRQWLCMFWKDGTYTKDAHKNLAESYLQDERFKGYYEKITPGCAEFFKKAIDIYCS